MTNQTAEKAKRPAQHQSRQPGLQTKMRPEPQSAKPGYTGSNKLKDKVAIITGGDSGIGRAVAIAFAKEGADVAIVYFDETEDAQETRRLVEAEHRRCLALPGDVGDEQFCRQAVESTVEQFKRLDVLVNNAAVQFPQQDIRKITAEQLERTFRTNIFAYFFMTKAALGYLQPGSAIINTSSVTAYQGSEDLLDYSSTKGAVAAFTRSLSLNLAEREIRVNAVAPGPIWTPLIPASYNADKVASFGSDTPMGRPGQPAEVAPCYVFLASDDSSYMSGQILHPNGGRIVNG